MEPFDDPALEQKRKEVEEAKGSFVNRLSQLQDSVADQAEAVVEAGEDVIESVSHAFDWRYQAEKRPWLMFGGAVAAGLIAGRLLLPRSSGRDRDRDRDYDRDRDRDRDRAREEHQRSDEKSSPVMSYLGGIFDQLGGLATTAATGVLVQVADSFLDSKPRNESEKPKPQNA